MNTAVITYSEQGLQVARALRQGLGGADVYVHDSVGGLAEGEQSFRCSKVLAPKVFKAYRNIVFVAPCGIAVRMIAPLIDHKLRDPAVVVMDVGARFAVSLLSGHEGGANELAVRAANCTGAEPVISTTTDAARDLIVGVGCRRGTPAEAIREAVIAGVHRAQGTLERVRLLASADIKHDEQGLLEAAASLGRPVRFIPSAQIRDCPRSVAENGFVKNKVNLPAVAEPCALLAGRRTSLILNRTTFASVTVAVARENFIS